jgi:hypothetical protein
MTAPLHAAIAAPSPFDGTRHDRARHERTRPDTAEVDRRAALAAHPANGPSGRARREAMLADLLEQAYLFDDPDAYEAGVRDAYERFAVVAG